MGLAVFHGHHLDGGFTLPFYKMLLNKPIVLDDITHVDPELHRSLTWMLYVLITLLLIDSDSLETVDSRLLKIVDCSLFFFLF